MHLDIAALVREHGLSADVAEAIEALVEGRATQRSLVSSLLDGFEPLDVDRTFIEGEFDEEEIVAAEVAPDTPLLAGRYQDLGPIGMGGMGEVRRVRDVELNRTLAMKILHAPLLERSAPLARFLEEAQATAQLQHPNIIPVHDIGTLPDGRFWFTMKEVQGRTLVDVLREVHEASRSRWEPGPSGWTFRRLVASFLAICHAMAYAHERGVVHRDLKPANVMVGSHGETYVLDWGLAKVVGRPVLIDDGPHHGHRAGSTEETIVSARSGSHPTRMGTVAGTPAYMAPEQARGEVDQIDARSDVYALGAVLYEVLAGVKPYSGFSGREVLAEVLLGPPEPVDVAHRTAHDARHVEGTARVSPPPLPQELADACARAMSREPEDRFSSALALATEVEGWLNGARLRDQARHITETALQGVAQVSALRERADELQAQGDGLLADIQSWQPEADRAPGWAKQDAAKALRQGAELLQLEIDQGLHGALRVAPDLPEAHAALAQRYLQRHQHAEAHRDQPGMARADKLMRSHIQALPEDHPDRIACAEYLAGDGTLTLVTDPPGAQVMLYRYVLENRRLVEEPVRALGQTPLRDVPVPMGRYLCRVTHPDCDGVRYPVEVPRLGHWNGVAPDQAAPSPIRLPATASVASDEIYVLAGWFRSGGDPDAANALPAQRVWCHAFVVHRTPVTNRQYLAFLDDLVASGREDEALAHAPRERAGAAGAQGALIYGFDGAVFSLRADADGDMWEPDWPVFQVDWYGARAYLAWLAERTGKPWRLPAELEWAKAARGVDGRWFPWGDQFGPSWSCTASSHREAWLPAKVTDFPVDVSPYGVRGTAGNVQDWCLDQVGGPSSNQGGRVVAPEPPDEAASGTLQVARGGIWDGTAKTARSALRRWYQPTGRYSGLGFRGVYQLE